MPKHNGFGREGGNNFNPLSSTSIGNILTLKESAKYMTGARTILKINGEISAFAMQVAWQVNTSQTEIFGIDDYLPHEIAPSRITVNGTVSGLIIPGKSLTERVIQSNALSFLFNKYITIEVRDSATDFILFKANKCVVTNSSGNLASDAPGSISLQFMAIGWQNEESPDFPEGYNTSSESPLGLPKLF